MRVANNEINQIVKTLEQIGHSIGVETAFRDWCECATLAFSLDNQPLLFGGGNV